MASKTTKRTRVPRASLSVTVLNDVDYIRLVQRGIEGGAAWGLFAALIVAAKEQGNGGRFDCTESVLATLLGWTLPSMRRALKVLTEEVDWLSRDGQAIVIRSFDKWNEDHSEWGGVRAGSGRRPSNQLDFKMDSRRNQDETILQSSRCASVSVSVSDTVSDSQSPPNPLPPATADHTAAAPQGGVERGDLFKAVAECHFNGNTVALQASRIGKCVTDLIELGATPEDYRKRHSQAKAAWSKPFGPEAVIKHWDALGATSNGKPSVMDEYIAKLKQEQASET